MLKFGEIFGFIPKGKRFYPLSGEWKVPYLSIREKTIYYIERKNEHSFAVDIESYDLKERVVYIDYDDDMKYMVNGKPAIVLLLSGRVS